MKKLLLLLLPFLFINSAYAFGSNTTKSDYLYSNSDARNPEGLWLFLGSNIGLVDLKDSTSLPNRDGHQVNFKVLGSLYEAERRFIYDLGVGFQSNRTSGDNTKINTQSFFIDANARYRFADNWSAGPVANVLLGNKNTFADSDKIMATFLGGTIHYETALNNQWIFKVGGRVLTDLDVSSRRVNKFLLDFQIGFPPTLANNISENDYIQEDNITFDDAEILTEVEPEVIPGPVVNIQIDDVNYNLGQVQPNFKDEIYINKLANVLNENQDLFEKVNVRGYAGDFKATKKLGNTNRIISHSRAKDVLKRLATNGLPNSKIYSMAFGELNPNSVSTDDRKVELEFIGVTDEARLRELIKQVQ